MKHEWRRQPLGSWDDGHDQKCVLCGAYWSFTPYGEPEKEGCTASDEERQQLMVLEDFKRNQAAEIEKLKRKQQVELELLKARQLLEHHGYKVSYE